MRNEFSKVQLQVEGLLYSNLISMATRLGGMRKAAMIYGGRTTVKLLKKWTERMKIRG